jgi:hypothetical protein
MSATVYVIRPESLPAAFIVAPSEDYANSASRVIVDHAYEGIVWTGPVREADEWLTAPVTRDAAPMAPAAGDLAAGLNVYYVTPGYCADDYRPPFRVLAASADAAEEAALTLLGGYAEDVRVQGQGPAPRWMFDAL